MITVFVITLLLLLTILVQDIRSRSIWWFLPPLVFGAIVFLRMDALSWSAVACNAGFIALLMLLLTGYIRLRWGKLQHPFREHFGWGDLLFILALTPLLPFQQFVYFFTAGTFLTLVLHLIVSLFRRQSTIPYAGYLALITGTYLILLQAGTDILHLFAYGTGLG